MLRVGACGAPGPLARRDFLPLPREGVGERTVSGEESEARVETQVQPAGGKVGRACGLQGEEG